jgi:hypothetical protein
MSRLFSRVLPALFALLPVSSAVHSAAEFSAESGARKVALLELYTSEGCSSCPPADKFVGNLARAGYYPDRVVPLAFHVTYWDYIGWRDRYASAEYDERQYAVASRQKSRSVYTPQLVLDGRNLRGTGSFDRRLQALNAGKPAAHISLRGRTGKNAVQAEIGVRLKEPAQPTAAALYVALVENGLSSRVSAGENRGRTLRHDHVVRRLVGPLGLPPGRADSRHTVTVEIPGGVVHNNASLAVFVQNRADGSVLQALTVPLTGVNGGP